MRKNPRPKAPNIMSEVRNLYSKSDGLMHNAPADNRVQATATSNELKAHFGLQYGKTIPDADLPYISKNLRTDEVLGRHDDNGENISKAEMIHDFGNLSAAYAYLKSMHQ